MTSPCLSRDPKSLTEYRDELRAKLAAHQVELDVARAAVFAARQAWHDAEADRDRAAARELNVRTRLAAVEAELAARGQE